MQFLNLDSCPIFLNQKRASLDLLKYKFAIAPSEMGRGYQQVQVHQILWVGRILVKTNNFLMLVPLSKQKRQSFQRREYT